MTAANFIIPFGMVAFFGVVVLLDWFSRRKESAIARQRGERSNSSFGNRSVSMSVSWPRGESGP